MHSLLNRTTGYCVKILQLLHITKELTIRKNVIKSAPLEIMYFSPTFFDPDSKKLPAYI
jgi:hypothetical protein